METLVQLSKTLYQYLRVFGFSFFRNYNLTPKKCRLNIFLSVYPPKNVKGIYIEREKALYQNGKGIIKLLIIENRDTIIPINIESSSSSSPITTGIIPTTKETKELERIRTK